MEKIALPYIKRTKDKNFGNGQFDLWRLSQASNQTFHRLPRHKQHCCH